MQAPLRFVVMDGEIVVRGEGEACAMPDRAVVRVSLDGEGTNREDAYAAAAQLANAVDAALEAADDAIERALTTGVVVQPKTRWHKGETTRSGCGGGIRFGDNKVPDSVRLRGGLRARVRHVIQDFIQEIEQHEPSQAITIWTAH